MFVASGCQKPTPSAPDSPARSSASSAPGAVQARLVSAEKTSFDAVARHLDFGGELLVYLSTENFLKTASAKLDQIVPVLMATANMGPVEKAQAAAAWNWVSRLTSKSGLNEVSGFGASSIAIAPGHYQSKWMLHHYEGQGKGVMWQIAPSAPNALDFISYFPETTAMATGGNVALAPLWDAVCAESGSDVQFAAGVQAATQAFEQYSGLKLAKVLAAIGPDCGLIVTLDESRKATVPSGAHGESITIPEPGLALLIQVKDEAVLNWVDRELAKVPTVVKADEPGLKLRLLQSQATPVPFLRPAVAWSKDLLIIASNDALVREIVAVKAGKRAGIAAKPEFKKLMAGLPVSGCQFNFAAPVFRETIAALQVQAARLNAAGSNPAMQQMLQTLAADRRGSWTGGVVENTPEGFLGTFHGDVEGSQALVAAGAVAPAAMVAAVAAPNFVRARKRSQASSVLNDLRMLDAALDQYAIEHNKAAGAPAAFSDLQAYLKQGSPLYKSDNRDMFGNAYNGGEPYKVDSIPKVNPKTFEALKDVAPAEFWSPFR